jgi:hypothetical protein
MRREGKKRMRRVGEDLQLASHYSGASVPIGATLFTLLRIVAPLVALSQIIIDVLLVKEGAFHLYMFTYWGQLIHLTFCVLLAIAVYTQGWLLLLVMLFVWPTAFGVSVVIFVGVVILINLNAAILMSNTVYEGGALTMDIVHSADWIIHDVPPAHDCLLCLCGLWLLARTIVGRTWSQFKTPRQRLLYAAFFLNCPLPWLAAYSMVFGIHEHYPTTVPDGLLWLALLPLVWGVMGLLLLSLVLDANVVFSVPSLPEKLASWTATIGLDAIISRRQSSDAAEVDAETAVVERGMSQFAVITTPDVYMPLGMTAASTEE